MADLIASLPQKRARYRVPGIRMDMTPMVDLAFLLLTFFILTTTLRRLEGMELVKPLGRSKDPAENTLTFLLSGRDSIYGYAGPLDAGDFPPQRMGLDQVQAALGALQDTSKLLLVVKTSPSARYGNVVDLLDEFARRGLRHYDIQAEMSQAEAMALGVVR